MSDLSQKETEINCNLFFLYEINENTYVTQKKKKKSTNIYERGV